MANKMGHVLSPLLLKRIILQVALLPNLALLCPPPTGSLIINTLNTKDSTSVTILMMILLPIIAQALTNQRLPSLPPADLENNIDHSNAMEVQGGGKVQLYNHLGGGSFGH